MISYEYEVCPFHQVIQRHHISTQYQILLGTWSHWEEDASGSSYNQMIYRDGDDCGNGLSRVVRVYLECGLHTNVLSVEEPETCHYIIHLETPLSCKHPSMDQKDTILETYIPNSTFDSLKQSDSTKYHHHVDF